MVAGGHAHALVYNRLYPWDHAPGWLLHREAGGYSARFDGSEYGPLVTDGRADRGAGPGELGSAARGAAGGVAGILRPIDRHARA